MSRIIVAAAAVALLLIGCDSQETKTTTPEVPETSPSSAAPMEAQPAAPPSAEAPAPRAEEAPAAPNSDQQATPSVAQPTEPNVGDKSSIKAERAAACKPELERLCPGLKKAEAKACLLEKIDQVAPDCAKFYKPAQ